MPPSYKEGALLPKAYKPAASNPVPTEILKAASPAWACLSAKLQTSALVYSRADGFFLSAAEPLVLQTPFGKKPAVEQR